MNSPLEEFYTLSNLLGGSRSGVSPATKAEDPKTVEPTPAQTNPQISIDALLRYATAVQKVLGETTDGRISVLDLLQKLRSETGLDAASVFEAVLSFLQSQGMIERPAPGFIRLAKSPPA